MAALLTLAPQAILLGGSLLLLLFSSRQRGCFIAAILLLFLAMLVLPQAVDHQFFGDFISVDRLYKVGGYLVILGSAVFAVFCLSAEKDFKGECAALLLMATAGLLTLLVANHFMVAYLALELVAMVLYVLIASVRTQSNLQGSSYGDSFDGDTHSLHFDDTYADGIYPPYGTGTNNPYGTDPNNPAGTGTNNPAGADPHNPAGLPNPADPHNQDPTRPDASSGSPDAPSFVSSNASPFIHPRALALEASLKYFVLGAVASAVMLYGMSLIYGFGGSLEFTAYSDTMEGGLALGLGFFVFGLLFKLAVVPFHSWAPDVYEGAPTPVTAYLSSVPKLAVFLFFLKFMYQTLGEYQALWQLPVAVVAALSMVLGGMAALRQSQIKRLLAYSSIGHVGFALVALAGGSYGAAFSYMAVYMLMNLGLFAVLLAKGDNPRVDDFRGLSHTRPILAGLSAVLLLSMAGLPPLAGFFIKLNAFMVAVKAGYIWLVLVAAVMTAVSAFYYLKIINLMYFAKPPQTEQAAIATPKSLGVIILISAGVALGFFIAPDVFYTLANFGELSP